MAAVNEIVPGMAEAIAARRQQLFMSVQDLVNATGVTRQGLAPLLRGERRAYQDRLKLPVCRVLNWTSDSIDRLLEGEPPVLRPPKSRVDELAQLRERLRRLELDLPVDELNDTALDQIRKLDDRMADAEIAFQQILTRRGMSQQQARSAAVEMVRVFLMSDEPVRDLITEQFAVAAEGADGKPPRDAGQRVPRPQPDIEDD